MAGNVFEWCWDWWDAGWYSTADASQADTCGPTAAGAYRVARGGSWFWTPYAMRCAYRGWDEPRYRGDGLGLRCVRGQTAGGSGAPEPGMLMQELGPGLAVDETPTVEYAAAASGLWQADPHALVREGADDTWEVIAGDGGARFFRLVGPGQVELAYCAFVLGFAVRLEVIAADGDTDGDTVPDCEDVCSGHDDRVDSDGDHVPDGCDICPGHDDRADADGDRVPDGCDWERTLMLPGGLPLILVRIPSGSFQMGSPVTERSRDSNEGPVHTVTIGYEFYVGQHEVTQGQWLAVMGSWPAGCWQSPLYGVGASHPAYHVTWNDAKSFITALNAHIVATDQGPLTVRLPSETEWEYACRAGTQTRFSFGNSLDVADVREDDGVRGQYMWYGGNNSPHGTKPVGTKLPNSFGLYDMHGNVWEWCEDWYHSSYDGVPTDGSAWVSPTASARVARGGGWYEWAQYCRSAYRMHNAPTNRSYTFGFRLAADQ